MNLLKSKRIVLICSIFLYSLSCWGLTFDDIDVTTQELIRSGKRLVIPVTLEDHLLKGTIYQWIPQVSPIELASIFYDYEHHLDFLPGMTSTRVIHSQGSRSRVRHRMNPIAFWSDQPPSFFHHRFFDWGAYTYDLLETLEEDQGTFTISWEMPEKERRYHSQEKGSIHFEPLEEGTLIIYKNQTEPFFYETFFQSSSPTVLGKYLQSLFCKTAESYYKKTIKYFTTYSAELIKNDLLLQEKITHLLESLHPARGESLSPVHPPLHERTNPSTAQNEVQVEPVEGESSLGD